MQKDLVVDIQSPLLSTLRPDDVFCFKSQLPRLERAISPAAAADAWLRLCKWQVLSP